MSLSDFLNRELDRLEAKMAKLAHNTLMGSNGSDLHDFLIAAGRYRELKAERDRWLERQQKTDQPDSRMEEMPSEEEPPARNVSEPTTRRTRARPWGGT